MTPEKLKINLIKLKSEIARKPLVYTSDHAMSVNESFKKYTRTSTINLILSLSEFLYERNWPFPAYILEIKPSYIKIIISSSVFILWLIKQKILEFFINKKTTIQKEKIQYFIDRFMCNLFYLCKKEIFSKWRSNPIFVKKHYIIDNIYFNYKSKYWYSCIISTMPLLDFLCRNYLSTNRLEHDITQVISMFRKSGILAKHVKPGHIAWKVAEEERKNIKEATEKDLRLVGIYLGSFLDFADIYYAYYRKETPSLVNNINRHAIIHGSDLDIWNKENATRILIFLDLMLYLEPALRILLKED